MPISPTSAPTDLSEIITNIGVLAVALGAAVAGWRKGLGNVKKMLGGDSKDTAPGKSKVLQAAIIETVTIQQWTEQNREASEQTRQLCLRLDDLLEEMREGRGIDRDFIDELRKLRLAMQDVADIAKALKR